MKIWLIGLRTKDEEWGSSWAYNHLDPEASSGGDAFLSRHEVDEWLLKFSEYWTSEGRNLFVYEGEYT